MKKVRQYGPGDKVFAKVRGYPPWPARVVGVADESSNISRRKYHIYFYGTGETAVVKAEDVFPYIENKNGKFGKPRKLKGFNEALDQIENELSPEEKAQIESMPPPESGDSSFFSEDSSTPSRRPSLAEKELKNSTSAPTNEAALDGKKGSLTDTSAVVESKTPKARKRKSEMPEPTSENKKAKVIIPELDKSESTAEISPSKVHSDVTSRSGRKIKPKKFSDFDEVLEQDTVFPAKNNRTSGSKTEVSKKKIEDVVTEDEFTFTHNDESVIIPLNLNRPTFKNHKSSGDWKKLVLSQAEVIKGKIISGEIKADQVNKVMDEFTREKINEKKKDYEEDDKMYAVLHVEGRLLQLDLKIKSALSLTKAEPEECLKSMDEFASLPITALMLKKNPEVVETFKRLRRYVGNVSVWNMTEEQSKVFSSEAQNIRNKADHIFNKMKGLFTVPEGKSFWSVFTSQLVDFNKVTKKLSQTDFYAITEDPMQN